MEKFKEALEIVLENKLVLIFITIVLSFVFYQIFKLIVNKQIKRIAKAKKINVKKSQTYLKLTVSICKYMVLIICMLIILQICGVNVTSMVAGLGILSAIAGLALQETLKDVIAGFNIIVDDYFSVGDFVEIDGIQGNILEISLKVTKIKEKANDNVLIISNRNIIKAVHISDVIDLEIPVPYEEDNLKIEKIIEKIVKETEEKEPIKEVKYLGINRFDESAIVHKIRLYVSEENRFEARKNTIRRIKLTLDKEKISIPYKQVDIHTKK